jgi:hypothetical protein
MTNLIVQAASPPALAKNARTGHPLFRNGKEEHGKLGHPPVPHLDLEQDIASGIHEARTMLPQAKAFSAGAPDAV